MNRFLLTMVLAIGVVPAIGAADRPNVLLVITDDQGYGDLGAHGNPVLKTPNLDAFTRQSVWLKNFYVCPVCAPTRASLLTGQYNYRTGVVDTFIGRALMRPDVKTLPEYLAATGYRTGLFGKWHLGDNYPLRPEDRGFQETLWSQGGGLAQPSDSPGVDPKTAYFDPVLKRNGKEVKTKGYCTDVFTDAAAKFIAAESDKPFFTYVAYNAPHGPYQVPASFAARYQKFDLTADAFPKLGQPWATPKLNTNDIANAYGMIENIDANFARLLRALDDKKLADNTIVIFMTDNGPGGVRFNAGLRNRKGTVYEGGIRVPCYVRWPAELKAGTVVGAPLAHIDITPTVLHSCGQPMPVGLDGKNALPLLRRPNAAWGNRTLFFQWHRGDVPEKFRAFAVFRAGNKLVQANGVAPNAKWKPKYELFDIPNDPYEQNDLAAEKPEFVAQLKKEYETWFADVTKKGFDPPRIIVGNEKENPVRLSRQDWRGPKAGWAADSIGHWEVEFARSGNYRYRLHANGEYFQYRIAVKRPKDSGTQTFGGAPIKPAKVFERVNAETAGPRRVTAEVSDGEGKVWRGVSHLEIEYLGPVEKK